MMGIHCFTRHLTPEITVCEAVRLIDGLEQNILKEHTIKNQHRKIKGYRELSQSEIDAMNEIKSKGAELGELVAKLRGMDGLDQRWLSIGKLG